VDCIGEAGLPSNEVENILGGSAKALLQL